MAAVVAAVVSLAGAAPAVAASGAHVPLAGASIIGDIFGGIGHAVLGAFSWTIGLASRFILTTIGALVRMLIPRSWASEGIRIMEWIVAVPNYAGTVTTPSGRTVYGFGGINALRDLFTWIGVGLLPLTLLYGTTRAMIGERGHVAVPLARVLGIAAVLVSYPYWWTQAAAMTDTVTHMVLGLPRVADGLHQLMLYAVDGVALGGWQLVDLALMAVVAVELLSLIFLKVVIILLGALLVRDRAGHDRPGRDRIGCRARQGVGLGGRDADRAADRVGDPLRCRCPAGRRRRHRRSADRGRQLDRLAARRRHPRRRGRRVAVVVPSRGARGDGALADATWWSARPQPPWVLGSGARHGVPVELGGLAAPLRHAGGAGSKRRGR